MKSIIISEQGQKGYMEDAHFIDENFNKKGWVFGGVYDGHNGDYAARYTAAELHKKFLDELLKGDSPQDAFVKSYKMISDELHEQESGTCAANFFIKNRKVFFANVGDVRIIIVRKSDVLQLTIDHRLDNVVERQRIEQSGGAIVHPYVFRGVYGLMVTRSLGDEYFKSVGVISTPEVGEYSLSDDDLFLIAASDGLFDVMNNEEVAQLARKYPDLKESAHTLKTETLVNRRGEDNLTAIIIALRDKK